MDDNNNVVIETILFQWYKIKKRLNTLENETISFFNKNDLILTISSFIDHIYKTTNNKKQINLMKEDDEFWYLPVHYGWTLYGKPKLDLRYIGNKMNCEFSNSTIQMNPLFHQPEAYLKIMNQLHFNGVAYLSLPPGDGKTIVSLKVSADLQRSTGILLIKTHWMDQWENEIKKCCPTARIGRVQSNNINFHDCDFVLIMVQTLLSNRNNNNNLISEISKHCGTFIIDEARHMNAVVFSTLIPNILSSRYVLCLDGTPKRTDGMDVILKYWIGPITFSSRKTYLFPVKVSVYEVPYDESPKEYFLPGSGEYNRSKMISELVDNQKRNQFILKHIIECVETGRNILILGERVKHLELMKDELQKYFSNESLCGILKKGLAHNKNLLEEVYNKQVILATFQMANDALNIPSLSILIYLFGKPNPSQSAPRVIRATSNVAPHIIYFYDPYHFWPDYFRKSFQYFFNEGFEIEFHSEFIFDKFKNKKNAKIQFDKEKNIWSLTKQQPLKRSNETTSKGKMFLSSLDDSDNENTSEDDIIYNIDNKKIKKSPKCPF